MEREYNCPVKVGQPKVAFREVISSEVDYQYEHKRQSGGRGQYGKAIGMARPNEGPWFESHYLSFFVRKSVNHIIKI